MFMREQPHVARPSWIVQAPWVALTQPPCHFNMCHGLQLFERLRLEQIYQLHDNGVLGHGAMAHVVMATDKRTHKKYAIKQTRRCLDDANLAYVMKDIRGEISALLALNECPHVIELVDHFDDDGIISLVMELAEYGDLQQYVQNHGRVHEDIARRIASQVLQAIEACHAKDIVHRDIKLENILISHIDGDQLTVKLADFGLSTNARHPLTRRCGTEGYMPPEMESYTSYGVSADIWSFGMMMYRALTYSSHVSSHDLFESLSTNAKDFIIQALQVDPTHRPSATTLRHHPWLMHP